MVLTPTYSCLEAAWFQGNTIPQTMGTFVPFHCIPQLQPLGLKAIVAFCVLQGWEIRRLAKAAAIHDTDGEHHTRIVTSKAERRDNWISDTRQSFRAKTSTCRSPNIRMKQSLKPRHNSPFCSRQSPKNGPWKLPKKWVLFAR